MIGLLLFLSIIALGLYGLHEYYKAKLGFSPMKTSPGAIEALANIIEDSNTPNGRLLELGSGFGAFVMGIARRLPEWSVVGIEPSPTPWIIANMRSIGKKYSNYRFHLDDPVLWPMKNYDIIFIHHDEKTLKKWEASIARRIQPETLLVTLNHRLPRVNHINMIEVDPTTTFYIYQKRLQQPAPTPEQIAQQAAAEAAAAAVSVPPIPAQPTTTVAPQDSAPAEAQPASAETPTAATGT